MALRSEVEWNTTISLKKPIKHSVKISVSELDARVPSVHEHFSLEFQNDKGHGEFVVLLDAQKFEQWRYDQESCSLLIPIDGLVKSAVVHRVKLTSSLQKPTR